MEYVELGRFAGGFVLVLALIGIMALVLKQPFVQKFAQGGVRKSQRLEVVETLYLDAKRKVVLLRCDEKEHLLLLSASGDMTITGGVPRQANVTGEITGSHT